MGKSELSIIKGILKRLNLYPSAYLQKWKMKKDYEYLKSQGVETEYGYVSLIGLPIVIKHPGSEIIIEDGVSLVSDPRTNPSGILHPCTLVTQSSGALIVLGKDSGMSGATICCKKSVTVGEYVGLGANVTIFDHDFHPINPYLRKYHNLEFTEAKEVVIGDFAWIGANSIILKGVHIGKGAVVGAGSVVTKDVPSLTVYAGNPAKFIKNVDISREQYETIFHEELK